MLMSVKYLQKRGGRLHYRRKIPEHLRPYLGDRREFKQSLGLAETEQHLAPARIKLIDRDVSRMMLQAERLHQRNQSPEALAKIAEEWALRMSFIGPGSEENRRTDGEFTELDHWLDQLERRAEAQTPRGEEPDPHYLSAEDKMKLETVKRGKRVKVPVSFISAVEAYTDEQAGGMLGKAEQSAFKQLQEWFNKRGTTTIEDVDRKLASDFITYLSRDRGQSAETIRRRLNSIRALWSFTIDRNEIDDLRNPWAKIKHAALKSDPLKPKASQRVLPFRFEHWEMIDRWCSENPGSTRDLIVLLKATGCRPLEIAGLQKVDVQTRGNHKVLNIRPNSNRRLKTEGSERFVPVVTLEAIEALDRLTLADRESLFRRALHNTNNTSQLLNKAIRAAGVPKSRRLVAYSIRHSVIEAMRRNQVREGLISAIVGHSESGITARYGAGGYETSVTAEALEHAQSALGDVQKDVYSPAELGEAKVS